MLFKPILIAAGLLLAGLVQAQAAPGYSMVLYQQGVQYQRIEPVQPLQAEHGKIEVVEVFSYACPHCWEFASYAREIQNKLPKDAVFRMVPAVFSPMWEPYARAFYAAQRLGVLKQTHKALFVALHVRHEPLYSLQQLAGFYAHYGVKPAVFLKVANSDAVSNEMMRNLRLEQAWGIDATPTIVVGGAYRSARIQSYQQLVDLTLWLVKREQTARSLVH